MRTLTAVFWCLLCGACGDAGGAGAGAVTATAAPPTVASSGAHTIRVFATHSLQQPFEALARRYESDHPGGKVDLVCAGGAALFARISTGEDADVVAIGDSSLMSRFAASVLLAPGVAELARNRIAIAVAEGNPKGIGKLADLVRPGVRLALGARSSSIGRHGRWVLSRVAPSAEPTVEADTAAGVLAKVAAGVADAGIVYVTTFRAATGVQAVQVPEAENTPVLYSVAVMRGSKQPAAARAFQELLLGDAGQRALQEGGFLPAGAKGR